MRFDGIREFFKYLPKKIHLFFMYHWIKMLVIIGIIGLASFSGYMVTRLESFYRIHLFAYLPLTLITSAVHALIFVYILLKFQGRMLTRHKVSKLNVRDLDITFKDVIGIDEATGEAKEVVDLIKNRKKLERLGGEIIRGILMIGPPGCGKTLLGKAIANEAYIPFLSVSGSEFVEVFVGVGASRVRSLFNQARRLAYGNGACIVFIDELDAIGQHRKFSSFGSQESDNTLNQILVAMDGMEAKKHNIIVIGATNAHESKLDKALTRPGRFDRKIYIDRPGYEGRKKVFSYYLNKVEHDPNIDIDMLARTSVHWSPAEIMNMVKEATIFAARRDADRVSFSDLSGAYERIVLGQKQEKNTNEEELRMTAYHEAGHLLIVYLAHPVKTVFKASIARRRGILGVVHHLPIEEYYSSDKNHMLANIKSCLGGYAAEKITLGVTTDGVSSDFKQAMATAHAMVWNLGMGLNGHIGDYSVLNTLQASSAKGAAGMVTADNIADSIKEKLNIETEKILRSCCDEVEAVLNKERTLLDKFADELLKKEELEQKEIEAIFNEFGKKRLEYYPGKAKLPQS